MRYCSLFITRVSVRSFFSPIRHAIISSDEALLVYYRNMDGFEPAGRLHEHEKEFLRFRVGDICDFCISAWPHLAGPDLDGPGGVLSCK